MVKYFPNFPDPANNEYYHRSDVDDWLKIHRTEWDMLYSQIDSVFRQRDQLCARINKLKDVIKAIKKFALERKESGSFISPHHLLKSIEGSSLQKTGNVKNQQSAPIAKKEIKT